MSPEDFHEHWREDHSKLVIEHTGQYLLRYEQNHKDRAGASTAIENQLIAVKALRT